MPNAKIEIKHPSNDLALVPKVFVVAGTATSGYTTTPGDNPAKEVIGVLGRIELKNPAPPNPYVIRGKTILFTARSKRDGSIVDHKYRFEILFQVPADKAGHYELTVTGYGMEGELDDDEMTIIIPNSSGGLGSLVTIAHPPTAHTIKGEEQEYFVAYGTTEAGNEALTASMNNIPGDVIPAGTDWAAIFVNLPVGTDYTLLVTDTNYHVGMVTGLKVEL